MPTPKLGLRQIPLDQIAPDPANPRHDDDYGNIAELAASIGELGLQEPLVVQPANGDGLHHLVFGHRRLRALQTLGADTAECIVRQYEPADVVMAQLVENLQRHDINPVDEALAMLRLTAEFGVTKATLATKIGRSASHVNSRLKIATLPDVALERVRDGRLTLTTAEALAKVRSAALVEKLAKKQGLTEWAIESAVRDEQNAKRIAKVVKVLEGLGVAEILTHDPKNPWRSVRPDGDGWTRHTSYPPTDLDALATSKWQKKDIATVDASGTVGQWRKLTARQAEERRLVETSRRIGTPPGIDPNEWVAYLDAFDKFEDELAGWKDQRLEAARAWLLAAPKAQIVAAVLTWHAVDAIQLPVGGWWMGPTVDDDVAVLVGLPPEPDTDGLDGEDAVATTDAWASDILANHTITVARATLMSACDRREVIGFPPLLAHLAETLPPEPVRPTRPEPPAPETTDVDDVTNQEE